MIGDGGVGGESLVTGYVLKSGLGCNSFEHGIVDLSGLLKG